MEDALYTFVLLILRLTEGSAVDMYVQSAGFRLVGAVTETDSFAAEDIPWHFIDMKVERHGMGDDFKPVIKRTIVLAVDQLKSVAVYGIKDPGSVVRILTGTVDLQFNAEIAITFTVEDGFWLVVVAVDEAVLVDSLVFSFS